jgi:outer membrane biogenesis lipoprotein LolB
MHSRHCQIRRSQLKMAPLLCSDDGWKVCTVRWKSDEQSNIRKSRIEERRSGEAKKPIECQDVARERGKERKSSR